MTKSNRNEDGINMGPVEQSKRRLMGNFAVAFSVGLIIAMVGADWPRWARLLLFIPVWMAALGIGQARQKVCIGLAIRGVCNMDQGEVPLDDPFVRKSLKEKAWRIQRQAVIIAAIATLIFLACPPY
jgi:hypothetical protein